MDNLKDTLVKAFWITLAVAVVVGFLLGRVSAWSYNLVGNGECQDNGSFKITWTLDNTGENEALHITASNRAVVAVGTNVPANTSASYTETVSGTSASSTTLTVSGNFNSDETIRERSATVENEVACTQPKQDEPKDVDKPQNDLCTNIEGTQTLPPTGMTANEQGVCKVEVMTRSKD